MGAALPIISVVATVLSTVQQAAAAKQSAAAQAASYNYQAAVAQNNQTIANQAAVAEEQRGKVMAQQKQQETAARVGALEAATGGSGLDIGGSPLRLKEDTLSMGDLDARTIRYNAERAAYGYRVQGTSYAAQANMDRAAAENTFAGGRLAAMGSVISGTANVADKWWKYKQVGASPFS